jgi:hypothetical protein
MIRNVSILLLLVTAGAQACTVTPSSPDLGVSQDSIVDVDHTPVKRQSIGNCWLYATATWAESLHKSVAGEELNVSESYLSYWHWFEQIVSGDLDGNAIQTGGWFRTGVNLMARYGVMNEADFIQEEAILELSVRQKSALEAVNLSLKSGVLADATARGNRELVRNELNRAYRLNPAVVAQMDGVFGVDVNRTLETQAVASGTIRNTRDIAVRTIDSATKTAALVTLADAIGTKTSPSSFSTRQGRFAWKSAQYSRSNKLLQRATLARMQRAVHDAQPVVVSWFVDFNALDQKGRFLAPPASPGRGGGHMVVVEDYEIDNVPGFGTLSVGINETRTEALQAALDPAATIRFIRVKNSWGSFRPDRQFVVPGYHDLYMAYLNGPVKRCAEKPDGNPDVNDCRDETPLNEFILPAGY